MHHALSYMWEKLASDNDYFRGNARQSFNPRQPMGPVLLPIRNRSVLFNRGVFVAWSTWGCLDRVTKLLMVSKYGFLMKAVL